MFFNYQNSHKFKNYDLLYYFLLKKILFLLNLILLYMIIYE